ncbi:hypothetical protein UPYG_G00326620 [Umbra pygmaea]|uniref:Uncharacterized protein n=1 Tax=Umbra pygmaea TaxID=75934 RepID=A0ABD0W1G2_UMBPY
MTAKVEGSVRFQGQPAGQAPPLHICLSSGPPLGGFEEGPLEQLRTRADAKALDVGHALREKPIAGEEKEEAGEGTRRETQSPATTSYQ